MAPDWEVVIPYPIRPLSPGVQKVGTAGTTGVGQTHLGWTKLDSDEQIIGHIMERTRIFCPTLTNWTFGSLSRNINTLTDNYWTIFLYFPSSLSAVKAR